MARLLTSAEGSTNAACAIASSGTGLIAVRVYSAPLQDQLQNLGQRDLCQMNRQAPTLHGDGGR